MTVPCEHEELIDLIALDRLRIAVARAFERSATSGVAIACCCRSGSVAASVGIDGKAVPEAAMRLRVGCLAKLLTASLAQQAFAAGLLAPDDDIAQRLDPGIRTTALCGVTVRHLLEHTHGLDDSQLNIVPCTGDGLVDTERMLSAVTIHRRIAPPGTMYSYGSVGAGLVAAALETRLGRAYAELLRDELFAPLGIDARSGRACQYRAKPLRRLSTICPATGQGLVLSAPELLRLIERAVLKSGETWPADGGRGPYGPITPLPGWNPLERGVYLGWKHCGHGWFGHQSVWPGASIFARAHPVRRVAVVVMSRDRAAAIVAARVLGSALPELFDLQIPRGTNVKVESCVGRYASAGWTVDVDVARGGLRIAVRERSKRRLERAAMRPVADGLFFRVTTRGQPERIAACSDRFPYVQFVAGDRAVASTYLWNGRFVLPRLE